MADDIVRLIAACDRDLVRLLIEKLAPAQAEQVDWSMSGRELGSHVRETLAPQEKVWIILQRIAGLARHATRATIPSLLHEYPELRAEFEEIAEGNESAAVWLATKDADLFEFALSALHLDQGLSKRSWRAFRVRLDKGAELNFGEPNRRRFEVLVREAIRHCAGFDNPGALETHHFRRVLFPEETHSRRTLDQVTVFAEARRVTEEAFIDSRVQTLARKRVDSISISFDRQRRELDVVTIGGRTFIEEVARSFFSAFSDKAPGLQPLIRRQIDFSRLTQKPDLTIADPRHFQFAFVDEIRVVSPTGLLLTFDAKARRTEQRDVYDIAAIDLGDQSPFGRPGWRVISARILFVAAPKAAGRKPRMRTVDLKSNGHTNLREQDDIDRHIADECLTKWGILEPLGDEANDD